MSVLAVIPARYASTRFPGKPLAADTGKYLIQHVCELVANAKRIDACIVATDDERIAEAVRSFGGRVEMTSADHPSGTDRIAEVAERLGGADDDIIVNVQGDEPEIEPGYLDRLVERLENSGSPLKEGTGAASCADLDVGAPFSRGASPLLQQAASPCATLACPFAPPADPRDPNCVKVVLDQSKRALYFSRSLIPYRIDDAGPPEPAAMTHGRWLLHLGVYAYRRTFLLQLAGWRPSALERAEKLEQLRVLEHGQTMAVEVVEQACAGIDTPQDYEEFVKRYRAREAVR